jgi:ribosome maturation factor RimP
MKSRSGWRSRPLFLFSGKAALDIAKDIETRAAPALAEAGLELVDVEWRGEQTGWVLRFYIDKPGGFTLEDCADWTSRLEALVEETGLITRNYNLEVSSPGSDRPLKKLGDFQKFAGKSCILKTREPLNNQRNFRGVIAGAEGTTLTLVDRTTGRVSIPLDSVLQAKLDPE